jgi:hypothetical protein
MPKHDYSQTVKLYSILWLFACVKAGETSISPKALCDEIAATVRQQVFSRLVISVKVSVLPTRPRLLPSPD